MSTSNLYKAWADHNRRFANFNFVYPVISRRSGGLSIGINCTPNKVCSFNCIYCQVNKEKLNVKFPSVESIIAELKEMLDIYKQTKFEDFFYSIEEKNRILKDIAFSGDGEPTLYPYFAELNEELKTIADIPKLVLITNAVEPKRIVNFDSKIFETEVWGKLDAASNEWLQIINNPTQKMSIEQIESNLKYIVSKFKLRIQSMFCEAKNKTPSEEELSNYVEIVKRIYQTNPQNLLSVQLYSVARQTFDSSVKHYSKEKLEDIKRKLKEKVPALSVGVF